MRSYLLSLLLVPCALSAQSVRTGPRLGVGLATISAGQFLEWNGLPKIGPIFGWSFEIPWAAQASFLVEPMYITKGSLVQNAQLRTWTSNRLGYLELPVMIKFSLQNDPGGIFLAGGAIGGLWMNGRYKVKQDGNVLTDQKYTLSGTSNRTQVSLAAGMGWDIGTSAFEVRIQQSVTPFSPVIRGQNLVVGLHYTYYLPEKKERPRKEEEEN